MIVGSDARVVEDEGVALQVTFGDSPEVSHLPLIGNLLQRLEPSDVFPVIASIEAALLALLALLAILRWRDRTR